MTPSAHQCEEADECRYDLRCPNSATCFFLEGAPSPMREVILPAGINVVLGAVCERTNCRYAGTVHGHGVGIEVEYGSV